LFKRSSCIAKNLNFRLVTQTFEPPVQKKDATRAARYKILRPFALSGPRSQGGLAKVIRSQRNDAWPGAG
jgi:hypothetical protein